MTPLGVEIVVTIGLGLTLVRLSMIDLETYRLPDRYTVPLIVFGLGLNAVLHPGVPWDSVAGAVLGFSVFAGLGSLFFVWKRTEGLGLGDAKLLAAAGAWLGVRALPSVVLIAALAALTVAMARGTGRDARLAFGPWLALAFWMIWVWTRFAQQIPG